MADKVPVIATSIATQQQMAFYKDMGAQLTRFMRRYKTVSTVDAVSIMACLTGVLIGRCAPEVQPIAKAVVMRNIDITSANEAGPLQGIVEALSQKTEEPANGNSENNS